MERASAILATDRVSKCSRLSCIYITCRRLSSSSTIKTRFAILIKFLVLVELTFPVQCQLALNPPETSIAEATAFGVTVGSLQSRLPWTSHLVHIVPLIPKQNQHLFLPR